MIFTYASVADYLADSAAGGEDAIALSSLDDPTIEVVAAGSDEEATLQDALQGGTRQIDGILSSRYSIPLLHQFDPPLLTLVDINIDLARYQLERYAIRDHVKQRRDDALARLDRISKGRESLIDNLGSPINESGTVRKKRRGRVGKTSRRVTMPNMDAIILPGIPGFKPKAPLRTIASPTEVFTAVTSESDGVLQAVAATPLSALRVVTTSAEGLMVYASSDDLSQVNKTLGITQQAYSAGDPVTAPLGQIMTDSGWNWDSGQPIFLGLNGILTQAVPTSGYLRQVASPISSTSLYFEPQEAIIL